MIAKMHLYTHRFLAKLSSKVYPLADNVYIDITLYIRYPILDNVYNLTRRISVLETLFPI